MRVRESPRRLLLSFVMSLALARPGFPQDSHVILGRVTDASGGVIVGASVTVTGRDTASRLTVTDGRGEFYIAGLPSGAFVLHVERKPFAPADVTVTLSDAAPRSDVHVVLHPAGFVENLTVTGAAYASADATAASKIPLSRRELPQSLSVLTRTQMNDQNMVTTSDALSQVTGITTIPGQDTRGQFYARGAALDLQLDGAPSAQPLNGYQQYDLAIYERVEVQRGPAGLLQGAGSFGGAVNLVRRRPSPQLSGFAFATTDRWNNHHGEAFVSGPLTNSVRGLALVAATDRGYFYERSQGHNWLGYVAVEWDPATSTRVGAMLVRQSDANTGFSGLPSYTDGRLLEVSRAFNPNPDWNHTRSDSTDLGLEIEHRFSPAWTLRGNVTRRNQEYVSHYAFTASGVDRATQTLSYTRRDSIADYISDTADAYLSGRFRTWSLGQQWIIGSNIARFASSGAFSEDPSLTVRSVTLASPPAVLEPAPSYHNGGASRTLQSGLYTLLRTRIGSRLSTVVGGRWSNFESGVRSIEPAVPSDWVSTGQSTMDFTPHAGAVVDATGGVSVYASYSEIFQVQTAKYVDGRVLGPRVGGQWEVGVKGEHRGKRLLTSAATFRIRDRNRAFPDSLNPGFSVPLGEVESRGWEAEVTGRPAGEWDLSVGYTWLETKYLAHESLVGEPLSYWFPKHSFKAWSAWRVPRTVLAGLKVGVGVQAYSSSASGRDTPAAPGRIAVAARRQGPFAVASVNVSYTIRATLQLGAHVTNVLDRTYYARLGGTNGFNWFGEPRNAAVFLRWQR